MPYVPLSHPFVERLIGTVRRECLDRTLFWTAADLELKLLDFQRYYNGHRAHAGLDGSTPEPSPDAGRGRVCLNSYRWQSHCRGLYQTPMGRLDVCDVPGQHRKLGRRQPIECHRVLSACMNLTGIRIRTDFFQGRFQHNWDFATHRWRRASTSSRRSRRVANVDRTAVTAPTTWHPA